MATDTANRRREPAGTRQLALVPVLVLVLVVLGAGCAGPARDTASGSRPGRDGETSPCPARAGRAGEVAYASVPGVPARFTSLDVYPPPSGCPAPVVVWIHGGGWVAGDKRNGLAGKIALARARSWLLVSVNYRLTDPADENPYRYPTHNEDVATAVAWVHRNIAAYGGDPDRIVLLGHSAGAQIAASVGTDGRYLDARGLGLPDVRCVGALDTEGFDVVPLAAAGNLLYRAAFGDDPATWRDASPVNHVAPGKGIPAFLVVERGTRARRQAQQEFVDALRAAGVEVSVLDARGLTHAQVNTAIGQAGDAVVTPALIAFVGRCFGE